MTSTLKHKNPYLIHRKPVCRISGEPLIPLFSLGNIFISDFVQTQFQIPTNKKIPLTLCMGEKSGLIQLADTINFSIFHERYWYHSGTNASMRDQLKDIALSIQKVFKLKSWKSEKGLWVDIGANDCTLLSNVKGGDYTRVAIDPVKEKLPPMLWFDKYVHDYFRKEVYDRNYTQRADVITSIAMFYDIEDPHSFIEDINHVLDKDGLWVIQLSYLPLMIQQMAFDSICHEHLCYYSLTVLKNLLEEHNFEVVDCTLNETNEGSFRVFCRKKDANPSYFGSAPFRNVAKARVDALLAYEKTQLLDVPMYYEKFFDKINALKDQVVSFLKEEKAKGKSIWLYGASTKGNTLLQYFGIDNTLIDGAAERQKIKYGLRTIGTDIPIYSDEEMRKANPDYLLVLPWQFINEFVTREKRYLKGGGKFIVPCPEFKVISG